MCGIVGYTGHRDALPILLNGLKTLEYRGYDSAGVALVTNEHGFEGEKKAGKLSSLTREFENWQPAGRTGIGHTRWATHGPPSDENSHPHYSFDDRIAVVHNGIIENYAELRAQLIAAGIEFRSDTDTEGLAHLIAQYVADGVDLREAVQKTLARCHGSWALLVLHCDEPGRIVASRRDSPLIVGVGANTNGSSENLLASDVSALIEHTRKVIYLDEGDLVDLRPDRFEIFDAAGQRVERKITEITWNLEKARKGGEPHFMVKEIKEQPDVLRNTINAAVRSTGNGHGPDIEFPELKLSKDELAQFERIIIVACGTAWHAGLVGKYAIEELARVPVDVVFASELRYADPVVNERTLVIAITQSGETEDTKKAFIRCREMGARCISICNVVGASIPRESHGVIYTLAGPEIGVASTKAYTTQLVTLLLFALHLARSRNTISKERSRDLLVELRQLPELVRAALACEPAVKEVARYCAFAPNFMYLGRNYNFATALEGALKLKEITYIHAEGYATGEMKHGPLALVDNTFPVVAVVVKGRVTAKIISNLKEVEARNGIVIAIASEGVEGLDEFCRSVIRIPETSEILSPVVAVIPLQLLAYHVSVSRQIDPDKPRNLAKAVTVE
ncbi:MAG: glutamine--fructose-6-phosphate transaminase (isomerizing) [Planctomycetota bacterium]